MSKTKQRGTLHKEGAALFLLVFRYSAPGCSLGNYLASSVLTRSLPAVSGVKNVVTKEIRARTSE